SCSRRRSLPVTLLFETAFCAAITMKDIVYRSFKNMSTLPANLYLASILSQNMNE
ncbi:MAG: hypothetical protein ACI9MF_000344, partial [Gammaproteobacteria bacterium]